MFQRHVTLEDVREVLLNGETIENYPSDTSYPSRFVLGWSGARPLHVVAADNALDDETIVITVYELGPARWSADWKTRL